MVLGSGRRRARHAFVLVLGAVLTGAALALLAGGDHPLPVSLSSERAAAAEDGAEPAPAGTDPVLRRPAVPAPPADDEPAPSDVNAPAPTPAALWTWITDLQDDTVRGNGLRAMHSLRRSGPQARPWLERALLSRDLQQRQFAAAVLRESTTQPSDALLAVCVEGLRRDLPRPVRSAHEATRFLAAHTTRARPLLCAGLGSDCPQQAFLCGFLLAFGGHQDHLSSTCAILVEHLADNQIGGDALMSAHALFRLGPAALPAVRNAMPWMGGQGRELLLLIELDLVDPPRDRQALQRRKAMQSVTQVYHDPVIEFDLHRSRVATW